MKSCELEEKGGVADGGIQYWSLIDWVYLNPISARMNE